MVQESLKNSSETLRVIGVWFASCYGIRLEHESHVVHLATLNPRLIQNHKKFHSILVSKIE